jgi:MFS transporter, ACS family, tartrate transporter
VSNAIATASGTTTVVDETETKTMRRVSVRLLPLLVIAFLVTYLDRVNIGFAALTANRDLGLSPQAYAWGAGIFFLGYFLFELPSNLALERFGARRWIGRILITIGLVSAAMTLVEGARSFYLVRFLLGVSEAGLFPGVIYYMSKWFPQQYKAHNMALFLLAIPLSGFIGAPVSGAILSLHGALGLRGWQWLYLLEGLPAILLGLICFTYLTDTPAESRWLTPSQRDWLVARLAREEAMRPAPVLASRWRLALDPTLLAFALIFFGVTAGTYGLSLWLPLMLKKYGISDLQNGLLTAIPFAFGCIGTVVLGRSSDRRGERVWHTMIPCVLSAAGLAGCLIEDTAWVQIVALSVASIGLYGVKGPFWALATERLAGTHAAPGIAVITSLAGLAGFVGPYVVGWIKAATDSYSLGMLFLAFLCAVSGMVVLVQAGRRPMAT